MTGVSGMLVGQAPNKPQSTSLSPWPPRQEPDATGQATFPGVPSVRTWLVSPGPLVCFPFLLTALPAPVPVPTPSLREASESRGRPDSQVWQSVGKHRTSHTGLLRKEIQCQFQTPHAGTEGCNSPLQCSRVWGRRTCKFRPGAFL